MAKPHSKSENNIDKSTKTEHYYTVDYVSLGLTANLPPVINIKGRWLEQIVFLLVRQLPVTIETIN